MIVTEGPEAEFLGVLSRPLGPFLGTSHCPTPGCSLPVLVQFTANELLRSRLMEGLTCQKSVPFQPSV